MKSLENEDLRREYKKLKEKFMEIVFQNTKSLELLRYEKQRKREELEKFKSTSESDINFLKKKEVLLKSEMYNILEKRTKSENILIGNLENVVVLSKSLETQLNPLNFSHVLNMSFEQLQANVQKEKWRDVEISEEVKGVFG